MSSEFKNKSISEMMNDFEDEECEEYDKRVNSTFEGVNIKILENSDGYLVELKYKRECINRVTFDLEEDQLKISMIKHIIESRSGIGFTEEVESDMNICRSYKLQDMDCESVRSYKKENELTIFIGKV